MSELYTVKVSFDFVVVAEDDKDAKKKAAAYSEKALSDTPDIYIKTDIEYGVSAKGWDGLCIPYGGDGVTTTADFKEKECVR